MTISEQDVSPSSLKRREKPNIRRRGSSWVVRFRRDGRSIWKSFKTREEAERFLAEARLRRALRAPEPMLGRKRFAAFSAAWLEHMKAHVSPKTWEGYEGCLRVHLVPELGGLLLSEITRRELDELISDWVAAGPRYQDRLRHARQAEAIGAAEERRDPRPVRLGHSPKTVSNAIVPLREMLQHAVEWNYLSANPAIGLRRPRPTQRAEETMQVLDPAQVPLSSDTRSRTRTAQCRLASLAILTSGQCSPS